MKWYQKAVFRLASSVLPAEVRRQMMGAGRATVPKNANPWTIFNWLPKKYQQAHNVDLTKLQNYTAEELLELLVSVHPDVSHALYTYLRMGETSITFTATDQNGKPSKSGQRTVDQIRQMLNTPLPSPGYQHGRSLEKLDTTQRFMVMLRGACAGEVVLNERLNDVVDIVPVDPSLIWFRRDPDTNRLIPWQYVKHAKHNNSNEEWFGQYKKIDTPTFIYEELDPMVDDPYGRTPILPVLQVVFFHLQVLQDLKAVVHNQGYPRITVNLAEEIMLKNMPRQYAGDPNKQRAWLNERMEDMKKLLESLNPDDALFGWDSVKYDYLKTAGTGSMIDIKKLIDIIDTQLATALKTLLTLLSRHQGSTETYSSVDVQLYIKTVESARNIVKRFWERALSLSARIKGVQTKVKAEYAPIDLRTEQELEEDRKAKLDNLVTAEKEKYITPEEAAKEARLSLGFDPEIPAELIEKLKTKQEQPTQPPSPPPPAPLRSVKLDNSEGGDEEDQSNIEAYIAFYLLMMGAMKERLDQVQSIDRIEAYLLMPDGLKEQNMRQLWELYRQEYVDAWNKRADETGTDRIRSPDSGTSIDMFSEARRVTDGTTDTYHDEMRNKLGKAYTDTADIEDPEERLKKMRELMRDWMDDYSAYKSVQIANHEALIAYHKALFAHDEAHAPDTLYDVEPRDSEHGACIEIIEGGPYTLEQAKAQFLPLHPNCVHHYVPRPID